MLNSASILLGGAIIVTVLSPASAQAGQCPKELEVLGACNVNTDGTSVTIGGTQTTPGTSTNTNPTVTTPVRNPDGTTTTPPPPRPKPRTEEEFVECLASWGFLDCYGIDDPTTPEDETETVIPPITIADLTQFTPAPTTIAAEPDNVGVAGLPANLIAQASATTQNGTLFGFPVSVRFTPSAFVFQYGDDSDATLTTGGQSWEALGQAQFTPTPTSHVYTARGAYQADVDVRYTAEIDLGAGWFPVTGELTSDGPPQTIRIYEARTALVAHTCTQAPDAPGC